MAGQQFVFISANDFGRTDSTDQMRIRSHCMQGKNRKAGSRRSKRNAASKEHQVLSQALNPPLTFPDKSPAFQCSEDARTERPHIPSSSVEGDDDEINPSDLYLSPPFLSSCLAFLPLADELNCTSREYLSEFLAFIAFRFTAYPIELCLDFHIPPKERSPLRWICQDAAYLHSVLLSTAGIRDFAMRQAPSQSTSFHLQRTISLLNRQLGLDKDAYLQDSVAWIVMTLHMMAGLFDDHDAAKTHMDGLRQILRLRRNRTTAKLRFKIECLTLAWTLRTGSPTNDGECEYLPYPRGLYPRLPDHASDLPFIIEELVDARLAHIFYEMQNLANTINRHFERGLRFPGENFRISLSSIQSRILCLRYSINNEDVLSESLRLGILAFLSTITLQLPVQRRIPLPDLSVRMRRAYRCVLTHNSHSVGRNMQDLLLWLLVVGSMSVLYEEEWLRAAWSNAIGARLCAWEQARQCLERVIWIGCIHNGPGEKTFASLIRNH